MQTKKQVLQKDKREPAQHQKASLIEIFDSKSEGNLQKFRSKKLSRLDEKHSKVAEQDQP